MEMTKTPRVLNCNPSKNTEADWPLKHAIDAGIVGAPAALPAEKDLRQPWWKIANQGTTGSCVGWATADSVLRWHFVMARRIGENEMLSPRFTWMASKETDEFTTRPTTFIEVDGTSLKAALDVSRRYGAVRDSVLPFDEHLFQGDAETFYAMASQLKIASYFNLGGLGSPNKLRDWKIWLATHGPIVTRLDVDATWDAASQTAGRLEQYQPTTGRGGHAVAIVGYLADGSFIVRNSWGTEEWGDHGYGYASVAYADAAFTESYGVNL
jgi:hypothetical protein